MLSTERAVRIRDRMMADHARLTELVTRLMAAFEANARDDMAALWNQLDTRLSAHLDAEEKFLFPALAEIDPAYVRRLQEEHDVIRKLLIDLGVRVDLHTIRLDVANDFIAMLTKHARREDELLYRWSDEHLDRADRDAMLGSVA
jgi:hemerythrin